jgi:glutathione S-transferase
MKICSAAFSPNALRVRAVAYELGLDFDLVEVM